MSKQTRLRKSDLMYLLEEFLSTRLSRMDDRVKMYALNNLATLNAKLRNVKDAMGYDFDFISKCVENVGLATSIQTLDSMSQLIMKAQPKKNKTEKPLLEKDDIEGIEEE